jgi:hypothetical protein
VGAGTWYESAIEGAFPVQGALSHLRRFRSFARRCSAGIRNPAPYEPFLAMSADGRVGPGAAVGAGFLDQLISSSRQFVEQSLTWVR